MNKVDFKCHLPFRSYNRSHEKGNRRVVATGSTGTSSHSAVDANQQSRGGTCGAGDNTFHHCLINFQFLWLRVHLSIVRLPQDLL